MLDFGAPANLCSPSTGWGHRMFGIKSQQGPGLCFLRLTRLVTARCWTFLLEAACHGVLGLCIGVPGSALASTVPLFDECHGFQEYFLCIKCELKFGGLADLVCPHSHKHRSSSMDNWIPGCRTGCFSFVTWRRTMAVPLDGFQIASPPYAMNMTTTVNIIISFIFVYVVFYCSRWFDTLFLDGALRGL